MTTKTKLSINVERPTKAELLATATRLAAAGIEIDSQVFNSAMQVANIKKQMSK